MKKRFWFFAVMLAIIYVIMYALPYLGQVFIDNALNKSQLANGLFSLFINLLSMFVSMGMLRIALNIYEGKPVDYEMLFTGWPYFLKYLGGMILYGLICIAGFILLIVPGIIWAIKYQFVPYLILEGLGPIQAIKRSGVITKGVKLDLFLFGLVLALISIAGFILLFIGSFAAQPTVMMAMVFVYKKLQNAIPKEPVVPELGL